jgi:hypothetical protein
VVTPIAIDGSDSMPDGGRRGTAVIARVRGPSCGCVRIARAIHDEVAQEQQALDLAETTSALQRADAAEIRGQVAGRVGDETIQAQLPVDRGKVSPTRRLRCRSRSRGPRPVFDSGLLMSEFGLFSGSSLFSRR